MGKWRDKGGLPRAITGQTPLQLWVMPIHVYMLNYVKKMT